MNRENQNPILYLKVFNAFQSVSLLKSSLSSSSIKEPERFHCCCCLSPPSKPFISVAILNLCPCGGATDRVAHDLMSANGKSELLLHSLQRTTTEKLLRILQRANGVVRPAICLFTFPPITTPWHLLDATNNLGWQLCERRLSKEQRRENRFSSVLCVEEEGESF